jgi:hypothetical protein
VAHGIGDEVREHLLEPALVAHDLELGRLDDDVEPNAALGGERLPLPRDVPEEHGGAHALALERHGTGLELREVEELLDEIREPLRLCKKTRKGVLVRDLDPVDQVLELRAQRTDRRPQLMRRVRDQISADAVDLGQLRGHAVEGTCQLAHLVTRGSRDPPLVVSASHRPRGIDHLPQRRGHPVREQLHDGEGDRPCDDARDDRREPDPIADRVDDDGDDDGEDDDDPELELDRPEKIEWSHSKQLVSSA